MNLVITNGRPPRWFKIYGEVVVIGLPNLFSDRGITWATRTLATLIVCDECRPEAVYVVDTSHPRRKGADPRAQSLATELAQQLTIPVALVWHERTGSNTRAVQREPVVKVADCGLTYTVVRKTLAGETLTDELKAHLTGCSICHQARLARLHSSQVRAADVATANPQYSSLSIADLELI